MPTLVIDSGAHKGMRHSLPGGGEGEFTIGRDETASIKVDDMRASRHHCRIRLARDGAMTVSDLDSRNGTYLNGLQIAREEPLAVGDQLQVGDTVLSVLPDAEDRQPADPFENRELAGYRVLERVGRGGMGTVYRAVQKSLNREVALKILSPDLADDPARIKNFVNEARAAGQLNNPHIIQVYDVQQVESASVWFISMEYAARGSIKDELSAEGALPPARAIAIITDAARGLLYAEQKGIVHRDIKPDNLMVTADGVVKIGDLGLASAAGESATERSDDEQEDKTGKEGKSAAARVFGTPHYIAPEQAQGKPVDHRADLYALGGSFFRIVTGRPPFDGKTAREIVRKHIYETPPSAIEAAPGTPKAVARIIEKLMAKRPEDRYQSAADLLVDLEAAQSLRSSSRRPALFAGAAVILLALTGAAIFGATRSGEPREVVTPDVPVKTGDESTDGGSTAKTGDNSGDKSSDQSGTSSGTGNDATESPELVAARAALGAVADLELSAELVGHALADAYIAVADAHPETPVAAQARTRAELIRTTLKESETAIREAEQKDAAARDALARALADGKNLISERRYGQAIHELELVGAGHAHSVAGSQAAPGYITIYREQAKADLERTKGLASELAGKKEWDGALAELQRVIDLFGIPEHKAEAERLMASIARERQRAQDAIRHAAFARDDGRIKELNDKIAKSRATTNHDPARWAALTAETKATIETAEFRELIETRERDYREAAALLAEFIKRYEEADGLKTRTFATPAKRTGMGETLRFTAPGTASHVRTDGRTFKVVFKRGGAEPVTSIDIGDFTGAELVNILPTLWDFTPDQEVALAILAAALDESSLALEILDRISAKQPPPPLPERIAALRERLGSQSSLARELAAKELNSAALSAIASKDHAAAEQAISRLLTEFADTKVVAQSMPPNVPAEKGLDALLEAARAAQRETASAKGERYVHQFSWASEHRAATTAAVGFLDSLDKGNQWLPLGRAQMLLENFGGALRTFSRYEKEYLDSEDPEITSGRIYLDLAQASFCLKDRKTAVLFIEKAKIAPAADQAAIANMERYFSEFDPAWERAEALNQKRTREKGLVLAEQLELIALYKDKLRFNIAERAEILNLLRNFSPQIKPDSWQWRLIDSYWDVGDYSSVCQLAPQFMKDHPAAQAVTSGEAAWRAAESMRKLDDFKRALTYYKQIEVIAPESDRVLNGTVAGRIKTCEKKLK